MARNDEYDLETEVTIDGEEVTVNVKIGGFHPATRDTWECPGDGAEVEIMGAYLLDQPEVDVWAKISSVEQDRIMARAVEKGEDDMQSAMDDAAECRARNMEDDY